MSSLADHLYETSTERKAYRKKFNATPKHKAYVKAYKARREYRDRENSKARARRRDPALTARYIVTDSRRADKLRGYANDLSREVVEKLIAKGCAYCGETKLRMTLDRIDNSKGHTLNNVVPACIRCNITRGTMPYVAWCVVAPAFRQVRELGLLEGWEGDGLHKRARRS